MALRHELGRRGEELAARHLEKAGWTILDRNWRSGRGEVDLVAGRGRLVAFVEVKTRSGFGFGDPLESITASKRREIEGVAIGWLTTRGKSLGGPFLVRFDAVAIELLRGRPPVLRHIPDAWRPGDA